jgi:hypothetical protein
MLHALLMLAATAEEHTSKTAFYVLGGALAVYAVVLSAVGLSRADFADNPTAARGVIGLTTLLVAGAMATAIITA